jgi:hypothetical protein
MNARMGVTAIGVVNGYWGFGWGRRKEAREDRRGEGAEGFEGGGAFDRESVEDLA